jgi:beta-glucosidase
MSAYQDLNDIPASGNTLLLHDVLRRELSFRGLVVSDAFSVRDLVTHGFARDPRDAAARALAAGVEMDMGSDTYSANLPELIKQGRITLAMIDDAVRSVLATKVRLGLFEHPYVDESQVIRTLGSPENRQAARLAAVRSAVLLRNEGSELPLLKNSKEHRLIGVIGPIADSGREMLGSWAIGGDPKEAVTVLQGIRAKVGETTRVEYAAGVEIERRFPSFFDEILRVPKRIPWTEAQADLEFQNALDLARRSDQVVLVLGELANMSGEDASRTSLDLPGRQEQLMEAVVATGKPTVLVLLGGRPLNVSWAAAHVPAILEAWYPGTEGGSAIADLLFGDANPGGKLPITWPRSVGQEPLYYDHNLTHKPESAPGFKSRYWDLESSPLYPFGFGLSYTTFSVSNLSLESSHVKMGGSLKGSVTVANRGNRTGDEVVQIYVHQMAGSTSRPVRELKGFERLTLKPGESKPVSFTLGPEQLSFWSGQDRKWVEEPENFDLWVGSNSQADLHTTFQIER